MKTVELEHLALAFVPVLVVVGIFFRWELNYKKTGYALARMLVQLLTVGYVLAYIFKTRMSGVVLAVLLVMVVMSSWIALNTVAERRRELYRFALGAIALGGSVTLAITSQVVLAIDPWYSPRYLIPLGGMVFANAMTSVSLCAERFFSELKHNQSYTQARAVAFNAALIPVVNSLFAVGLVALPGMMTGQILSGVSPLIAARYQIMVMCMLFTVSGFSASLFLYFLKKDYCHD